MRLAKVSGAITVIAICMFLMAPTSAWSDCGDCYWASWAAGHGVDYADAGVQNDTYCSFPWGGGENVVGVLLGNASDDGSDAESLLWQAYQTCNCATATAALNKAIEARDSAQSAVDMCAYQYCEDNDACPYAGSALSFFNMAVGSAQTCKAYACNEM